MSQLMKFLPVISVGVCAGLKEGRMTVGVVLVELKDRGLKLTFPKSNPFQPGDEITVHLDDRVGSEVYSIELKVHRCSYKAKVSSIKGLQVTADLVQYELYYGSKILAAEKQPEYSHAAETRKAAELKPSVLKRHLTMDEGEKSNKLGVLITRGVSRLHTTVMAFLNSLEDDVFLISQPETYKFQNLLRDPRCAFAMDHRGTFNFERQFDWNYTIYETLACKVEKTTPLFGKIQAEFVDKNPWEAAFFQNPAVEMIHLKPLRIIHQDIL